MKKLFYLLFAVSIFTFVACDAPVKKDPAEVVACAKDCAKECCAAKSPCADDCQKACCLGCKATEGDAKCIVLEDGSMPCCIKADANCCCGDATCDGSCHGDAAAASKAHEGHDENVTACCCGDATCDGSCHGEEIHDHGAEGHSH